MQLDKDNTNPADDTIIEDNRGTGDNSDAASSTLEEIREASSKGWVPEDKYTGETSKWVDAHTFLERGKRFNSNLVKEVATLKGQIESFKGTAEAFKKFHEESMQKKDKELSNAIQQLKRDRNEAIRLGDDDDAEALEGRIETLNTEREGLKETAKEAKTAAEVDINKIDPELTAWMEDGNDWFATDKKLQAYAIAVGNDLKANGEKRTGRAFLDLVSEQIKADFPKRFTNQQRNGASIMETSGNGGRSAPRGKTEADLPEHDRTLMKEFVSAGYLTKEQFLKDYFANS